jgi:hypothetical protein
MKAGFEPAFSWREVTDTFTISALPQTQIHALRGNVRRRAALSGLRSNEVSGSVTTRTRNLGVAAKFEN